MKTETLSAIDTAAAASAALFSSLRNQVSALLPDDPPPLPVPATPTGFAVTGTAGTNPLQIIFGWDALESGCAARLQYKGAPGSTSGPDDWTDIPTTEGVNSSGTVLQNPDGQSLLLRLIAQRDADGQQSEAVQISFPPTE